MSDTVPTDEQVAAIFIDLIKSGGMERVVPGDAFRLIRAGYAAARASAQDAAQPVAFMFQHDETGRSTCVWANECERWAKVNPRWHRVSPLYAAPPAAPVEPPAHKPVTARSVGLNQDWNVCSECGMVEPRGGFVSECRGKVRVTLREPPAPAAVATWVPHIIKEGSRKHVISYHGTADGAKQVCNVPNCEINKEQHHDDESDRGRTRGLAGEGDEGVLQTGRGNRAGGCDRASEHGAGLPHPQQYADPCGGNAARVADATPAAVEALRELVAALDDCADASEGHDDVAAMLRYADAEAAARAVLQSLPTGGEG
jgi:hypothetical protein